MANINLYEVQNSYSREELIKLCRSMKITKYSKLKKLELAKQIAECLLQPLEMQRRLACLSDDALDLFNRAVYNEYVVTSSFAWEDYNSVEALSDTRYACFDADRTRLYIPNDVKDVYKTIKDRPEFNDLHMGMSWLLACIKLSSYIYGVVPEKILFKLYETNTQLKNLQKDALFYFVMMPDDIFREYLAMGDDNLIEGYEDVFIANTCFQDYENLLIQQGKKEFYIPTSAEIREFSKYDCLRSSKAIQAVWKLFLNEYRFSVKDQYLSVSEIWQGLALGYNPQDIVKDIIESNNLKLTKEQLIVLIKAICAMSNETRTIYNRGYTPQEMSKISKIKTIKVPYSKPSFQVLPLEMGIAPARPNISRNAPCPCGSGKKYKRCCGKQ